jgi:hypothetical protein
LLEVMAPKLAEMNEVAHVRLPRSGKPRTPTLKVSIGCMEGFIGEDMFFYAGPGALKRAQALRRCSCTHG